MHLIGRPSELAHRCLQGRLTASGQVCVKLRKIEDAVIGVALGAVPVISGFLAGWWISVPLVPESRIYQFALAGLVLGILVDVFFLRGWVRRAYSLKPGVWRAVYVFYRGCWDFRSGSPGR